MSRTVRRLHYVSADRRHPALASQVVDELINGAVSLTYAYGLQRISENQLSGSTWTPSFYGYDGHGNVRFLANMAGTVTDAYQSDAFGRLIASTGTTPSYTPTDQGAQAPASGS